MRRPLGQCWLRGRPCQKERSPPPLEPTLRSRAAAGHCGQLCGRGREATGTHAEVRLTTPPPQSPHRGAGGQSLRSARSAAGRKTPDWHPLPKPTRGPVSSARQRDIGSPSGTWATAGAWAPLQLDVISTRFFPSAANSAPCEDALASKRGKKGVT